MSDILRGTKVKSPRRFTVKRYNLRGWALPILAALAVEIIVRLGIIPAWVMPPRKNFSTALSSWRRGTLAAYSGQFPARAGRLFHRCIARRAGGIAGGVEPQPRKLA
ncbi:hypothetical protein ACFOJF_11490 [Pseudocitrobacter faecalis]